MPVLKNMITSPAYLKLGNPARVAYLLLSSQRCQHDQREVIFPYGDAQKYMKSNTFSSAIKQLEEFGFITKTQCGGLYRRTNIYRFSEKWKEKK